MATAVTIHRLFLVDSTRRTPGSRAFSAVVAEGSEAASPSRESPATGGPDVALDDSPFGSTSWGSFGSSSFMVELLLLMQLPKSESRSYEAPAGRLCEG